MVRMYARRTKPLARWFTPSDQQKHDTSRARLRAAAGFLRFPGPLGWALDAPHVAGGARSRLEREREGSALRREPSVP